MELVPTGRLLKQEYITENSADGIMKVNKLERTISGLARDVPEEVSSLIND